jgi:hypothetical protein
VPLIVFLLSQVLPHAKRRAEATALGTRRTSDGQVMGIAGSLLVVVLAIVGWYLLSYQKELIIHFAGKMYARQEHALPFDHHLPAIEAYLLQIRKILVALAAVSLFLAGYFLGRKKLLEYAAFTTLPYVELTYVSAISVIFIILSAATMLNHLVPLSLLNFLTSGKAYSSINGGYYGLYPGNLMPPGFFGDIFPQCIGKPLLIWAAAALVLVPLIAHSKRKLLILICFFAPFALQISLWNTTFRASRFAFNLFFLLYMFGGLLVSAMSSHSNRLLRTTAFLVFGVIAGYTLVYSIAFNKTRAYQTDARVRTALWMESHVPKSSTVAISGKADIPRSLGPVKAVFGLIYQDYEDQPDYCILDGFEHHVMRQYFLRTRRGYTYTDNDWWPSKLTPDETAISAYDSIINEKRYALVESFESMMPTMLGFEFRVDLLQDPAFFYHHKFFVYKQKSID